MEEAGQGQRWAKDGDGGEGISTELGNSPWQSMAVPLGVVLPRTPWCHSDHTEWSCWRRLLSADDLHAVPGRVQDVRVILQCRRGMLEGAAVLLHGSKDQCLVITQRCGRETQSAPIFGDRQQNHLWVCS